jgi:hypothetical protein
MMKLRLESIEEDEIPEEVSIILEDLNLLFSSINSMYESAIPWTTENFGCSRETLNQWRIDTLIRKKKVEKHQKKVAEDEKSRAEIYQKTPRNQGGELESVPFALEK